MPFSVRLPEEMLAELDKEAKRRVWSRTHVLQACVERALPELAAETFGNSPGRELKNGQETVIPEVEKDGQKDRSTGVGDGEDTGEAGASGTPEALINPKMVEVWAEIGANIRREITAVAEESLLLPRGGKAQEWHSLSDKPTAFESVLISDPLEPMVSSRMPTRGLAHVNKQGEWCTMHNGKSEPIHPSHLRNTKWMAWPYPPDPNYGGNHRGDGMHTNATYSRAARSEWSEDRLRELADAEPGGLMACSPELLTEFIEMAKTDSGVAETLTRAGVKLDSEK